MASSKPTPEEKLFAVIQGAQQPPLRARAQPLSLASAGQRMKLLVGPFDLPRINLLLAYLLGCLGLWCLASPVVLRPRLDRVLQRAQRGTRALTIAPPLKGLRSTQEYADLVRDKNPFRVVEPAVERVEPPTNVLPPPPPEPDYQGALANLKIVGISWGPEPTVMIEELNAHETQFLKPGETISLFTVKEILQNRVILRAGKKDFELF